MSDHLHAPYISAVRSSLVDLGITVTSQAFCDHSACLELDAPGTDPGHPPMLHWSAATGWSLTRTAYGAHERLHTGLIPHQAVVAHATARLLGIALPDHVLAGLAAYLVPGDDLRAVHIEETAGADHRRLRLDRAGGESVTVTLTPTSLAGLIEELAAAYTDWTGSTP